MNPPHEFLLCLPLAYDTNVKNNIWMQDYNDTEIIVNREKAMRELHKLYRSLTREGIVNLLPHSEACKLQDLVFIANNGIVIRDKGDSVFVAPKFFAPNRVGEELLAIEYFKQRGVKVIQCPYFFEGEADLKKISSTHYVGGYGLRSCREAYEWFEEQFGLNIIKVEMKDERLYHLDCAILPLKEGLTLVATDAFSAQELRAIEAQTEIVPVTYDEACAGITGSLVVGDKIFADYSYDRTNSRECPVAIKNGKLKQQKLDLICRKYGMDVEYFDLTEYYKGGASLSCLVLRVA